MTNEKLTVAELSKNIGKKALWQPKSAGVGVIKFEVIVKDVEILFGAPHYVIIPVAGVGQTRVRDFLVFNK